MASHNDNVLSSCLLLTICIWLANEPSIQSHAGLGQIYVMDETFLRWIANIRQNSLSRYQIVDVFIVEVGLPTSIIDLTFTG